MILKLYIECVRRILLLCDAIRFRRRQHHRHRQYTIQNQYFCFHLSNWSRGTPAVVYLISLPSFALSTGDVIRAHTVFATQPQLSCDFLFKLISILRVHNVSSVENAFLFDSHNCCIRFPPLLVMCCLLFIRCEML